MQRFQQVDKLKEVLIALLKCDNVPREYIEAGGRTFDERKAALFNILPEKFKDDVFFRFPAMQETLIGATMEEQNTVDISLRAQLQKQADFTL